LEIIMLFLLLGSRKRWSDGVTRNEQRESPERKAHELGRRA
jgi:hypothetical protein